MPGWHEATKSLQNAGDIQILGIVQEQHPDRTRLFMQYKQMNWPVMVDALNELEVAVVPITIFIDENGIVRNTRPPRRNITSTVEQFIEGKNDATGESSIAQTIQTELLELNSLREAASSGNVESVRAYARALVKWGEPVQLNDSIQNFQKALHQDESDGLTHFQLGVAYRKRYDSDQRKENDFQNAVNEWSKALDLNPNQYIWRRRIQQYGPRLNKPYPFYDWVEEARSQIKARGEMPVLLTVEPGGAEIARPSQNFSAENSDLKEPDPQKRITRDEKRFILAESTVAPPSVQPGGVVRVHLAFRPNPKIHGHWNNEAQPMRVWIQSPDSGEVDHQLHTIANAATAVSSELRIVEFEFRIAPDVSTGLVNIPVYALYNVCEAADGPCLYRRLDVQIPVQIHQSN